MKPPAMVRGQIVIVGVGQNGNRDWFRTRVLDADGDTVWIEAPFRNGAPILPTMGQEIDFHTWRAMDARYSVRARTVSVEAKPQPVMGVELLDATRVQQREYFRVPIDAEATGSRTRSDGTVQQFWVRIHDISAGGIRGRSEVSLTAGEDLELEIRLPSSAKPSAAHVRVARVIDAPQPPDISCSFGASFVNLDSGLREQIIQFTLHVQADFRRRGVL